MEVKRSPAFRIEALAFDGRRPGIRPVLAMVDAAAAEAGVAPAFTGDIAASIDYRRLAAGHTRCRVCRLYRSRLPGARDLSLMVHERYVAGGSVREIEAAADEMISGLGWPEGARLDHMGIWRHFRDHFNLERELARATYGRSAAPSILREADPVEDAPADLPAPSGEPITPAIVEAILRKAGVYADSGVEIRSVREFAAVMRWVMQMDDRLEAVRLAQQQRDIEDQVEIFMILRDMLTPWEWYQLEDRFWAGRGGFPRPEWKEALEAPPGPELAEGAAPAFAGRRNRSRATTRFLGRRPICTLVRQLTR